MIDKEHHHHFIVNKKTRDAIEVKCSLCGEVSRLGHNKESIEEQYKETWKALKDK